jgi:Rad52/22 family double-strand break repair protein/Siphovirus Gp157
MNLEFAAIGYRTIRDRIRAEDPQIDEQTLADTVEGLTDLHEIVVAIVRAALADEALATGLKGRIAEMEDRLERLQDCASKRRQIAKDVMVELDLKKITAPDFTVSIRPGMPALLVLDEAAVPSIYWEPREPRLNRQELLNELKGGADIEGGYPVQSRTCFEREGTVMGFSAKQMQSLRRRLNRRHVRTREANGRELSYIEGWYAISEANRIFGFDSWDRETVESRCVLAREYPGTFLAVYIARVRITVHAEGRVIIREGHGSGEGRGDSPGEVHDIALKAAETDATKRALATFGKPFGLELYRKDKKDLRTVAHSAARHCRLNTTASCRLTPRRYDGDSSALALLRAAALWLHDEPAAPGSGKSQRPCDSSPSHCAGHS